MIATNTANANWTIIGILGVGIVLMLAVRLAGSTTVWRCPPDLR
jgi:hypothetical protein